MMVAEKAADLILGNEPLPPATVEFYRHQPKQQPSDSEPVSHS
jgi:choline dehydrogenase